VMRGHASTIVLLHLDASPAIKLHDPRHEASRHTWVPSQSRRAPELGFHAQTEKTSSDGLVAKQPNPVYKLRLLATSLQRLNVHDFILLFLNHAAHT
jgi:hypothetical protein